MFALIVGWLLKLLLGVVILELNDPEPPLPREYEAALTSAADGEIVVFPATLS